jgi:hypothetical protein
MKETASDNRCPVIDLARELPKNSKYFYDYVHFTNEGAEVVAEIVFKNLYPWLDTTVVGGNLLGD